MPAERLSMRKVREVLRLKYACGASERVIARSVGIGRTAIGEYIRRAAVIGLTWPVRGAASTTSLPTCRLCAPPIPKVSTRGVLRCDACARRYRCFRAVG
jgi:hypothetical protein